MIKYFSHIFKHLERPLCNRNKAWRFQYLFTVVFIPNHNKRAASVRDAQNAIHNPRSKNPNHCRKNCIIPRQHGGEPSGHAPNVKASASRGLHIFFYKNKEGLHCCFFRTSRCLRGASDLRRSRGSREKNTDANKDKKKQKTQRSKITKTKKTKKNKGTHKTQKKYQNIQKYISGIMPSYSTAGCRHRRVPFTQPT